MAEKVAIFWITLVMSFIGANASCEFTVLHSPKSLKFTGQTKIEETILKDVFSASLGLSVEKENVEWNGLYIDDPFNSPQAAVEVNVDGISSLFNSDQVTQFPLTVDEYEPATYEAVAHRIKQHFNNAGNKLVSIKLSDPKQLLSYTEIFGDIPAPKVPKRNLQHLKKHSFAIEEYFQFLTELETLKAITSKVKAGVLKAGNSIDFFYFRFTSLSALSDFHSENSTVIQEAKKFLSKELRELSKAFVKAYDGSVLVTVVTTGVALRRRTIRAVLPDNNDTPTTPEYNIQINYYILPENDNENPSDTKLQRQNDGEHTTTKNKDKKNEKAPNDDESDEKVAMFNIIVWFGIAFAMSMMAIVYAILDMDPGRDSIIYRMTSMRTKKDN